MRRDFARLRFVGQRFDEATMPLEVLPELAAYRVVLVELALEYYLERNPERERAPKGFRDSLRLVLDRIDSGSAVPNVSRVVESSAGMFPPDRFGEYYEHARDTFEEAIAEAEQGRIGRVTERLRRAVRSSGFGRTLATDEAIFVAKPSREAVEGVRFDRSIRTRILEQQGVYTDVADVIGTVRAADVDNLRFGLMTAEGRVDVQTMDQMFEVVRREVGESDVVRVVGLGQFREGKLVKILNTQDVVLLDEEEQDAMMSCPTSVVDQIQTIRDLKPGWYDQSAEGFSPEELDQLRALLENVESHNVPRPYVYPTPDRTVRAEWSTAHWSISAEFEMDSRFVELLAVSLTTDDVRENEISDFAAAGAVAQIAEFVLSILRGV